MKQETWSGCHIDTLPCLANDNCTTQELAGSTCPALGRDGCDQATDLGKLTSTFLLAALSMFGGCMPAFFSMTLMMRLHVKGGGEGETLQDGLLEDPAQ